MMTETEFDYDGLGRLRRRIEYTEYTWVVTRAAYKTIRVPKSKFLSISGQPHEGSDRIPNSGLAIGWISCISIPPLTFAAARRKKAPYTPRIIDFSTGCFSMGFLKPEGTLRALWKFGAVGLLVGCGALLWLKWRHDEPRRDCVRTLQTFCQALNSKGSPDLLQTVVIPQAVASRTAAEQMEFLQKALRDEISAPGIRELSKSATFGSLKDIFPLEADRWAAQAGVKPEECLAFRMEHGRIRAEVVVFHEGQRFQIVRCNNVRQMAEGD